MSGKPVIRGHRILNVDDRYFDEIKSPVPETKVNILIRLIYLLF